MHNSEKCFLIITDRYFSNESGAVVTRSLIDVITSLSYKTYVFSCDIEQENNLGSVVELPAKPITGWMNIFPCSYRLSIRKVLLQNEKISHVLFVGSITNKPLVYIEEVLRAKKITTVFIFMQDFFCPKFYANDKDGPCIKCLEKCQWYALRSDCGVKKGGYVRLFRDVLVRKRLKKLLKRVNYVGTSTATQLEYYRKFGIPEATLFKLPLPFNGDKMFGLDPTRGDYFIGIAQNRIEKGFQFISDILQYTHSRVILAFYNDDEINSFREHCNVDEFIENGFLSLVSSSWGNDLGRMIAGSQGVLIPSIWPTTTEYGLLEALALGKPIIAFDIAAHSEFIKNGVHGFLCPLGDFYGFGHNIDVVAELSELDYNEMSNNDIALYKDLSSLNGWRRFIKSI